jgi:hypothetical protein
VNKKPIIIGAVVLIIVILALFLNQKGLLYFLNSPLNSIISGVPDKSCSQDSDCMIKDIDCDVCGCGDAVNKEWKSFCPFKKPLVLCEPCSSDISQAKCVDNQCTMVQ